jgi:hypothetical protein
MASSELLKGAYALTSSGDSDLHLYVDSETLVPVDWEISEPGAKFDSDPIQGFHEQQGRVVRYIGPLTSKDIQQMKEEIIDGGN